jgi:hypothetical protein
VSFIAFFPIGCALNSALVEIIDFVGLLRHRLPARWPHVHAANVFCRASIHFFNVVYLKILFA